MNANVDGLSRDERSKRCIAEMQEFIAELRAVGVPCNEFLEISALNSEQSAVAVPVILRHLELPYYDQARTAIASLLVTRTPAVRQAWPALVKLWENSPDGKGLKVEGDTEEFRLMSKMMLANALLKSFQNKHLGDILQLLLDEGNGPTRAVLLSLLKRRRGQAGVEETLAQLKRDPMLSMELSSWEHIADA